MQASIIKTKTELEQLAAEHEVKQKNRSNSIDALRQSIEVLSASETNDQQVRIIEMHKITIADIEKEMEDAETEFEAERVNFAVGLQVLHADMAMVQDAIEINDCREEEEDSCKPPKYYCAPDPCLLYTSPSPRD